MCFLFVFLLAALVVVRGIILLVVISTEAVVAHAPPRERKQTPLSCRRSNKNLLAPRIGPAVVR